MTASNPQPTIESLRHAAGNAIHDINNQLLVISCSTDKLLEQIPSNGIARDMAAEIERATEQIAEATSRLQRQLVDPSPNLLPDSEPMGKVAIEATGETILVVDDDSQVRQFIKTALIRGGYHVLDARHGPAAIALALRHRGLINLLVTDMLMPEMTGRELADALRTDLPNLCVLYLSGLDGSADLLTQPSPLDAFVQKPFRMPELLLKIREILDK